MLFYNLLGGLITRPNRDLYGCVNLHAGLYNSIAFQTLLKEKLYIYPPPLRKFASFIPLYPLEFPCPTTNELITSVMRRSEIQINATVTQTRQAMTQRTFYSLFETHTSNTSLNLQLCIPDPTWALAPHYTETN